MTSQKLLNHLSKFPYVLAPMASITNAPFRLLMKELGAGVVISELISATGIEYGGQKTLELCQYFEQERPVGLQIFGEKPEHLAKAAKFLESKGVDFIDINLGCPVPKVVSKGGGAAMLKNPAALYEYLKTIKSVLKIPLTIKIRTGWDACSINVNENVAAAAEAGVTWVAIHGRTRAQGYEGLSNWDLISEVKSKAKVTIIGNGDILTAEQAVQIRKKSGCDGIMIGRGALRNPFIFLEIAEIEKLQTKPSWLTDKISDWELFKQNHCGGYWPIIERQTTLLKGSFNPFYAGVQLRKFMTWYSSGIDGASQFRKALYDIPTNSGDLGENLDQVLKLGSDFFKKPGLKKQTSYLKDPFLKGGHG